MSGNENITPPITQAEFWNQEGGERWAAHIGHLEVMLEPLGRMVLDRAKLRPGEAVLDVGCGGGVTTAWIADQVGPGGGVLGVDLSAIILEQAPVEGGNLRFLQADAGTHDFGEGVFDLVFSRFGVMFFEHPAAAFGNLRKALKPGGRLVFQCWTARKENPWFMIGAAAAKIVMPDQPKPDPDEPGPFYFSDEARIRDVLDRAGFKNIALEHSEIEVCAMAGGGLTQAADFALEMAGVRTVLESVDAELSAEVMAAVHAFLEPYVRPHGVFVPTVTWIVTASRD